MYTFKVHNIPTKGTSWLVVRVEGSATVTRDLVISGECVPRVAFHWHRSSVVHWEGLRRYKVGDVW